MIDKQYLAYAFGKIKQDPLSTDFSAKKENF